MQTALDHVLALLDVESIEVNIFRGRSPNDDSQRLFGGQVAGQALVAAARTVEAAEPPKAVHSIHAYFLRPGDPRVPVLYDVDRIRDGCSFTTRRVVAIQHGSAIFQLAASFHISEDGYEHAFAMPDVPQPEAIPTRRWLVPHRIGRADTDQESGDQLHDGQALDLRYVTASNPHDRKGSLPPYQQVWLRANGTLPDDPVVHTCILTYASDMTLLDTTLLPHGTSVLDGTIMLASLDHAMWFHGPFRADEWLLYDQRAPAAAGARGLATGRVFTRDGRLVASVVQEGLIRRLKA